MNERNFEKIKNRLIEIIDKVEKNSGLDYNKEKNNSKNSLDEKLLLKNQRELLLKANKSE